MAIGSMAATSITVVIRIGRSRLRLASRIASSRPIPRARAWFAASTCRMPFFLTIPNSMNIPKVA